ncbi:MAG: D-sedoheptulose 7-phosphate isomerase [Aminipila sp.]
MERIKEILNTNISLYQKMVNNDKILENIYDVGIVCTNALRDRKKLMICGNGGSASDAQHMAGELVGRFQKERKGLSAIALNTDTAVMTAWSNDYDFNGVFQRQVEALGQYGDILIGISTSGNSRNVLEAFEYARNNGMITVGILGKDGGAVKSLSDYFIVIPENCTARVQEAHITVIHILCELIENLHCEE